MYRLRDTVFFISTTSPVDHISRKVLTQYESRQLMFDYGWRYSCFQLLSCFLVNFVRGKYNSGLRMITCEVTYVWSRVALCLTSQSNGFARNDNKGIWSLTGNDWRNYTNNNVFLRSHSLNDRSFITLVLKWFPMKHNHFFVIRWKIHVFKLYLMKISLFTLPWIISSITLLAFPATLVATHSYIPASSVRTLLMRIAPLLSNRIPLSSISSSLFKFEILFQRIVKK